MFNSFSGRSFRDFAVLLSCMFDHLHVSIPGLEMMLGSGLQVSRRVPVCRKSAGLHAFKTIQAMRILPRHSRNPKGECLEVRLTGAEPCQSDAPGYCYLCSLCSLRWRQGPMAWYECGVSVKVFFPATALTYKVVPKHF